MRRLLLVLVSGVVVAFAGCGDNTPIGPDEPLFKRDHAGSPALNVVSYNVYVGAHVEDLLTADPNDIPFVAAQIWGAVLATNFAERAMVIAKLIDDANAHVVGLQEVALYQFDLQTDFDLSAPLPIPLPPPDADLVFLDFLDMLIAALAARGLSYVDAAVSDNMDLELPMACVEPELCPPGSPQVVDIRLTDRDVILVRDDVAWDNAADGNFGAGLTLTIDVVIPGVPDPVPVEIGQKPSGWTAVDIMFKGLPYRVVNTHLEPADVLPGGMVHPDIALIQTAQIAELLGMVGAAPYPVIMVGDFNSAADGSTTETYQTVRGAGFVDAWLIGPPRSAGFTSNQAPNLMNVDSELFHRIDYVFYRDSRTAVGGPFRGSVAADVLGEEQVDRTDSGLWPSDHAGVAATLRIAPAMR